MKRLGLLLCSNLQCKCFAPVLFSSLLLLPGRSWQHQDFVQKAKSKWKWRRHVLQTTVKSRWAMYYIISLLKLEAFLLPQLHLSTRHLLSAHGWPAVPTCTIVTMAATIVSLNVEVCQKKMTICVIWWWNIECWHWMLMNVFYICHIIDQLDRSWKLVWHNNGLARKREVRRSMSTQFLRSCTLD